MPVETSPSPDLVRRTEAARAIVAGQRELFARGFGRVESDWKADGSRVTEADHAISRNILGQLAEAFPEDQGFSEELPTTDTLDVTSDYAWMLDPIDGTNNYATGLVSCAIALALLFRGEPVYGVVYDFARRTILHGGPGFGMWDGERAAQVKPGRLGTSSLIGFHSPRDRTRFRGHADALASRAKIRGLGSSALHLAYVAAGLFDGTVDHNVRIWDIAAAIPMVRAAGGEVSFLMNDPLPLRRFDTAMPWIVYVAGNPAMSADLRAMLEAAGTSA